MKPAYVPPTVRPLDLVGHITADRHHGVLVELVDPDGQHFYLWLVRSSS